MKQTREPIPYVGRFAPSPTGPLHFGSLVAAVASYLQARTNNGRWLLRIEDIDPPREQAGASSLIIDTLTGYGFEWDDEVVFQSTRLAAHEAALENLKESGFTYPCDCSRRDLANAASSTLGIIYPGTCRNGCVGTKTAIRLLTDNRDIVFEDGIQGQYSQQLESESGDFVIRRKDNLIAYHLAVVVDDAMDGITEIVRGIDLLDSTPRQIYLQTLLGYDVPAYSHIPVIIHPNGDKLSKLTSAPGISTIDREATLFKALQHLQQHPPADLAAESLHDVWRWAKENWQIGQLFGRSSLVHS